MSKVEKLIDRLKSKPKDFTYDELTKVLAYFGFTEFNKGKTSGSRVAFLNYETKEIIRIHKPHPGNIIKPAPLKDVVQSLEAWDYI